MIMLDLQKAFDTVDHDILCRKLKAMGVESVEWFRSYLSGRTQAIHVNNTMSDFDNIVCGVPQGSILGPLLFLCYVNDMSISISESCKLILYADDSAILYSHKNPDVISQVLGSEIENCSKWLIDNKLSLHLGKTESVMFGSKRKLNKVKDFIVQCNGNAIKSQKSVKYLGVQLDNDLSGASIVNDIVKKVNGRIKFMYRQGNCLNTSLRKMLCNSLIQCHFDYACSSWYNGITKQLKNRLQTTQNKVIRFINKYDCRTSLTVSDYSNLGLLNIENRVKQYKLNHVHNIFYKKCPSYLHDNFTKLVDIHCHNTRGSFAKFHVPNVNSFNITSFYYNGIKEWNHLPDSIKAIENKHRFKKEVKRQLFKNMTEKENSIYVI